MRIRHVCSQPLGLAYLVLNLIIEYLLLNYWSDRLEYETLNSSILKKLDPRTLESAATAEGFSFTCAADLCVATDK